MEKDCVSGRERQTGRTTLARKSGQDECAHGQLTKTSGRSSEWGIMATKGTTKSWNRTDQQRVLAVRVDRGNHGVRKIQGSEGQVDHNTPEKMCSGWQKRGLSYLAGDFKPKITCGHKYGTFA